MESWSLFFKYLKKKGLLPYWIMWALLVVGFGLLVYANISHPKMVQTPQSEVIPEIKKEVRVNPSPLIHRNSPENSSNPIENREAIKHFTEMHNHMIDVFLENGFDEGSARIFSDRIKENLLNGMTSQDELRALIKSLLAEDASEQEIKVLFELIQKAVSRIGHFDRQKAYDQN